MKCPKCHDGLMVPSDTYDGVYLLTFLRCVNCGKVLYVGDDPPAEDK